MHAIADFNVLKRVVPCLFLLASGASLLGAASPRPAQAPAAPGTNSIPLSVFVDDERGKDPFFPRSTRRLSKTTEPEVTRTVGPASLVLLGITGPPERRLALINNQNFLSGEEQSVRVPGGGSTVVKCVEIRERSVMVTIQGGPEQYEIQILDHTLPIAPDGGVVP